MVSKEDLTVIKIDSSHTVQKPIIKAEDIAFKVLHSTLTKSITHQVNSIYSVLLDLEESVKKYGETVAFQQIHQNLSDLQKLRETLDSNHEDFMRNTFQTQILPLTMQSEFCKYCYEKPRGYAGDFVMMEMIWNGRTNPKEYRYRGSTELGKLINALVLDSENCISNILRVGILKEFITTQEKITIASFGSGSCIELLEAFKYHDLKRGIEIHLFDQDQDALETSKQKLLPFSDQIFLHQGNILKSILKCNTQFNLAYSSGLFDYFNEESSSKLFNRIWNLILPNGKLCVVNAHPSNASRFIMEYVMEWPLIYKDTQQFLQVAKDAEQLSQLSIKKDRLGIYQYFFLEKATR